MKKKSRARSYRCQGLIARANCKNKALIETATKLTSGEFAVPIKLKLCMPCTLTFNVMFPKLEDFQRSLPSGDVEKARPKRCGHVRATSTAGGYVCMLPEGHAGSHAGQGSTWGRLE